MTTGSVKIHKMRSCEAASTSVKSWSPINAIRSRGTPSFSTARGYHARTAFRSYVQNPRRAAGKRLYPGKRIIRHNDNRIPACRMEASHAAPSSVGRRHPERQQCLSRSAITPHTPMSRKYSGVTSRIPAARRSGVSPCAKAPPPVINTMNTA